MVTKVRYQGAAYYWWLAIWLYGTNRLGRWNYQNWWPRMESQ